MSNLQTLIFYETPEHACSYLEDEMAVTLFVDPKANINQDLYSRLSLIGFRRSGSHYYRPRCRHCNACQSVRIPVSRFQPSRAQKRNWQRNLDLRCSSHPMIFVEEHYLLYEKYITLRHADGDMYPPDRHQYQNFLLDARSDSRLLEFRDADNRLIAVSVIDRLRDGLSAIYTFFEPAEERRSPGSYAVLHQIEQCRVLGLPYLYMGYWIRGCRKMSYKTRFRPIEVLLKDRWLAF